jgi:hypothetical protein
MRLISRGLCQLVISTSFGSLSPLEALRLQVEAGNGANALMLTLVDGSRCIAARQFRVAAVKEQGQSPRDLGAHAIACFLV